MRAITTPIDREALYYGTYGAQCCVTRLFNFDMRLKILQAYADRQWVTVARLQHYRFGSIGGGGGVRR